MLAVAALLAVGCGGGQSTEGVLVVGAEQVPSQESVPAGSADPVAGDDPAASADPVAGGDAAPSTTVEFPTGPGGLARCDDVPRLGSRFEGTLSGRQNADIEVRGAVSAYGREHPDTYGGHWLDRANGGAIVVGFTDDVERHREAILQRRPSPDDDPDADPPRPITDDRPLGEREDVAIDVVRVRFSLAGMDAVRAEISRAMSGRDFGLNGSGFYMNRQRVSLDLVNPPEGALEELGELLPDPSAVCINLTITPQPPPGPLKVIPDLDVEDPLVSCPGTPAVRYSQLIDPPSIDDVDHPAVDVLRTELDTPGGESLPRRRWVVIDIDDDLATFAALSPGGFGVAGVERRGDKWIFAGEAFGRPCEPAVPLPAGLAPVEVHLDPDALPDPADAAINLLVTEQGCASGREMGDALKGPQIVETDTAVLVAFAVIPIAGMADCPGNPSASVTVELSEPLGQRTLYDGLYYPPKPITAAPR